MVEEKKLAGILVRAPQPDGFVIGVGVNLRPIPEFAATSTSLQQLGISASPDEFLAHFLAGFRARYQRMRVEPREFATESRREYLEDCLTIGRRVRVEIPDGGELRGLATGIDESGRLLVDGDSEFGESVETIALAAGDVWHLRNL
jgi:BirA family biotin operon repressor/biotin-[acetyl-CoA-carboxylase] ligase